MPAPSILIVEDEALIAWEFKDKLESWNFKNIFLAATGDKAIEIARANSLDLIFMDILLKGDKDGITTAKTIRTFCKAPIVFLTGNVHLISEKKMINNRTYFLLEKPVPDGLLIDTMRKTLGSQEMFVD